MGKKNRVFGCGISGRHPVVLVEKLRSNASAADRHEHASLQERIGTETLPVTGVHQSGRTVHVHWQGRPLALKSNFLKEVR